MQRKRSQSSSKITGESSPSGIDKYVVSDDDSDVSPSDHPKHNSERKRRKVSTKKDILPIQSLEPMPLKLNKSQIHSKKYPFPQKLFDLLEKSSVDDQSSKVVSWSPDGTRFVVHDHARFAAEFLPTHFGHTKLRSFDRQLNYWGFEVVSPREINNKTFGGKSWKHPFFQKEGRDLLKQVTRKMTKKPTFSRTKTIKESGSVSYPETKNISRASKVILKNKASEIEDSTASIISLPVDPRLRTRLRIRMPTKGVSEDLGLQSRIVSPVHRSSTSEISNRNLNAVLVSALDILEQNCDYRSFSLRSTSIEDEFLPLFPLESLYDDCNEKPEVRATGIAPFIDAETVMKERNMSAHESCPHVDIFDGNGFHDVDLTMDLGIIDMDVDMEMDMNIDETELCLNINKDGDGSNDCHSSECTTVHDTNIQDTACV